MRRAILAACVAGAAVLALTAGSARADPAFHATFSESGTVLSPAGTLCDFNEQETFTVSGIETIAPNGLDVIAWTNDATHTNLDTGYTLTEVDHFHSTQQLGTSTIMQAGVFWHLRDPSGKIVRVKAGEAIFNGSTGEFIKFTPNTGADQGFADVICPALGGNPA